MLGQFTREKQTDSGLNLSTGQSSLIVVTSQIDSFIGQSLENIVDEGVHNAHSTLADTHVRVDLLQHTVDVGGVRFQSSSLAVREISLRLRSLSALARSLGHFYTVSTTEHTKAKFKPYSFRFKFYLTFQNTIILLLIPPNRKPFLPTAFRASSNWLGNSFHPILSRTKGGSGAANETKFWRETPKSARTESWQLVGPTKFGIWKVLSGGFDYEFAQFA